MLDKKRAITIAIDGHDLEVTTTVRIKDDSIEPNADFSKSAGEAVGIVYDTLKSKLDDLVRIRDQIICYDCKLDITYSGIFNSYGRDFCRVCYMKRQPPPMVPCDNTENKKESE